MSVRGIWTVLCKTSVYIFAEATGGKVLSLELYEVQGQMPKHIIEYLLPYLKSNLLHCVYIYPIARQMINPILHGRLAR